MDAWWCEYCISTKIKSKPSEMSSLFSTSSIITACRLIEFYNLPSNDNIDEDIGWQPLKYEV